jgi:hypothetical protein
MSGSSRTQKPRSTRQTHKKKAIIRPEEMAAEQRAKLALKLAAKEYRGKPPSI